MNTFPAPRQESKEQCQRRLLTDLYQCEQTYAVSRRLQLWSAAKENAEECARVCRLLELLAIDKDM